MTGQVNDIFLFFLKVCRNKSECHLTGYFLCVGLSVSQERIKLKSEQPDSLHELSSNVLFSFSCRSTFRLAVCFLWRSKKNYLAVSSLGLSIILFIPFT